MDYRVRLLLFEDGIHCGIVRNIFLVKRGGLPADFRDTINSGCFAIA
jgi:hypothetical protein